MDLYFVTANLREEVQVIKELQPKHLLLSYWYFRKKNLTEWVDTLGYKPQILLDSGAWSAFNKGKVIELDSYMDYIREHAAVISEYVVLDVIGDAEASFANFLTMRESGLSPIPVFHYQDDPKHLKKYIDMGETRIALGGTVVERSKKKVAKWVRPIIFEHQHTSFHLLGSSSKVIMDQCPLLASCDSSTWMMMAVNGYPTHIVGRHWDAKLDRMRYQMRELQNRFEEVTL